MNNYWLAVICGLMILVGTIGSVLPFIAGLPLAMAALWVYAIATHFHVVTLWAAGAFTIFAILVEVLNIAAPGFGAKGFKSTRGGVIGATIGAVIGILIFGPVGIIVGPFLGAFIGEYLGSQDETRAIKSARGAVIGTILGGFLKLSYGLSMLIYFIIVIIKHK